MNKEEKFKNSLNDLLDEPYYAYDDSNWNKASQHLDEEDGKRKRRFLYLLFTFVGLGIMVSTYLLILPKNKITGVSQAKNEIISKKHSVPTDLAPERFTSITPKNTTTSTSEKTSGTLSPEQLSNLKQKGATQKRTGPAIPLPSDEPKKQGPPKHNPITSPIASTQENKQKKNQAAALSEIKEMPAEVKAGSPDITATPGPKASPALTSLTEQNESQAEPARRTAAENLTGTEKSKEDPETVLINPIPKDSTLKTLAVPELPDAATGAASQATLQNMQKQNTFYAEAGAYYNLGWKHEGRREGNSINPYLGLSYLIWLSDKTAFSFGAYYTTISKFNEEKTIKASRIVFGEETDVTIIAPLKLNYISIPLKLQYQLGSNQYITAGYSVGYLLDAQSKVTKYSERLGKQENLASYRTGGYVEGFRTFNSQLSLGYRRMLRDRLWINGEFFLGLTDLRDNDFFGINLKERASGLKISLTYDLIKK